MELFTVVSDFVSGKLLLALLAACGLILSFSYLFYPQLLIPSAVSSLLKKRGTSNIDGDVSPFKALMISLASTVGNGNIAGVATAVFMGGPGAVFWMWLMAVFGMATKFSETFLAVKFRIKNENGEYSGGPMYTIERGLGPKFKWLAIVFSFFGIFAGFGIGCTVQSNSMAHVLEHSYSIPPLATGLTVAFVTAFVLLGGVTRIAGFASKIVPTMFLLYVGSCIVILAMHWDRIPDALATIVRAAFDPASVSGGLAGMTVWTAMRYGFGRGIFSNEAGLGTSPIGHAAAKATGPLRQGILGALDVFVDTILISTATGLVLVTTGAWQSGLNGAAMTAYAFESSIPVFGKLILTLCVCLFALTTVFGWSYYSEKCAEYLFGTKSSRWYRIAWILAIPLGTLPFINLEVIWLLADFLNSMMALPNLVSLLLFAPFLYRHIRRYRHSLGKERRLRVGLRRQIKEKSK